MQFCAQTIRGSSPSPQPSYTATIPYAAFHLNISDIENVPGGKDSQFPTLHTLLHLAAFHGKFIHGPTTTKGRNYTKMN